MWYVKNKSSFYSSKIIKDYNVPSIKKKHSSLPLSPLLSKHIFHLLGDITQVSHKRWKLSLCLLEHFFDGLLRFWVGLVPSVQRRECRNAKLHQAFPEASSMSSQWVVHFLDGQLLLGLFLDLAWSIMGCGHTTAVCCVVCHVYEDKQEQQTHLLEEFLCFLSVCYSSGAAQMT